ncbi:hypothetical protein HUO13_21755 [Saccharopolyspora erythraea]|uniref:hypothetical protein n=1 Tax=Saccharopolyspora erythraea TaxID=1836 RepID=UPI001BAC8328|nr:hypothetical protein [Saccharopolyspora erythraea]QUH03096.1 hypothetical protein HUO13_21755 [Saccharopolyspora erythraea]
MATVWVALVTEAVVLLAAAGAAVRWVRRPSASAPDQAVQPVAPLAEPAAV